MRKSTTAITLTLLGPALLAVGCGRECDPTKEDCSRRSGGTSGFFGARGFRGGGEHGSFSGTSRGGFGSTGGAAHGGFSAGG